MSTIEETIFIDLWRRYFDVMKPFKIDLGDDHTGHVIPSYTDDKIIDEIIDDDDIEFVFSAIDAYVTVTHPKKAPFSFRCASKVSYISCDDNGNLSVNKEDKEKLINDIRHSYKEKLDNSGRTTPFFCWRASPLIWGAAGFDDRFLNPEGVSETITTRFVRYGFEPFIKNVLWGSASTTSIDSFEEAVQIDYCMDNKIRSKNAKVFSSHIYNIPDNNVTQLTQLKYNITKNLLEFVGNFCHGYIDTAELIKVLPIMEGLLTELAVYFEDFMKSMDVDWKVCLAFSDESMINDETFVRKYEMVKNGPALTVTDKDGNEKTINPRREFAVNYPLVMSFKDADALEALFVNYVDQLKELPPLTLLHDREGFKEDGLTPAKQKYIAGKFLQKNIHHLSDFEDDVTFINVAFRTLPVSKLPELAETPFDENINVFIALSEIMRTLFHVMVIRRTPSGKENENHQRLLDLMPKMTEDEVKSYPDFKVSNDLFYMFLCHHDVFGDLLKKYGSYNSILNKLCHISNVSNASKDGNYRIINIIDSDLKDIIDNIFVKKVVVPAIFHFAGKKTMRDDDDNQWEKVSFHSEILKAAYDILLYDRFPLIEMIAMNKHVHDRETRFMDAGNNPESLKEAMNESVNADDVYRKVYELLEKSNASIKEDEYRRRFELSETSSWFSLFDNTLKTNSGNLIVPLLTSSELKEEGNTMNNCVGWGGYAKDSRKGDINIFSVRSPDGERLATLEVSMRDGENGIMIAVNQLRGYQNSFLDDAVAHDIKDAINSMRYKLAKDHEKADKLRQYVELLRSIPEEESPVEEAGYGFHDYDSLKAAFEPWKEYLPKCMKTPDDFMMVPSFKALVENVKKNW